MPGNAALPVTKPVAAKSVTTAPVLVFLICRIRLYYDAVLTSLGRQAGIIAVGSVDVGEGLLPALQEVAPDAVLLDIGSPQALVLAARIIKARPSTRILGFGVDDVPPQVIACAEAGLRGYVSSHASMVELAHAARRVALGETVCSAGMGDKLFNHLRSVALSEVAAATDMVLTGRQQQILMLIKEGLSNKQIAQRLSLGTSTVKNHVHDLLGRLQIGRRTEAAARAGRRSVALSGASKGGEECRNCELGLG